MGLTQGELREVGLHEVGYARWVMQGGLCEVGLMQGELCEVGLTRGRLCEVGLT